MSLGFKTARAALDFFRLRKRSYQLAFSTIAGQKVLLDLMDFCRGNESCYHDDPRRHAVLEGRREVWLRIQQHMNLTSEQLFALYTGKTFQANTEEDDNAP